MKAANLEQLKKLVEENPYDYASTFLEDNSFAYHCYANNAYMDLCTKLEKGEVDQDECQRFNITGEQWKEAIEMALFVHHQEMMNISLTPP